MIVGTIQNYFRLVNRISTLRSVANLLLPSDHRVSLHLCEAYNTAIARYKFFEYKIDTFLSADILTRQVVSVFIQKLSSVIVTIRM